jgi:hypothetical protein
MMMMSLWCVLVVPLVCGGARLHARVPKRRTPARRPQRMWACKGISPFENVGVPETGLRGLSGDLCRHHPGPDLRSCGGPMKFSAWAIFVPVWSLLVYVPVTYWVANPEGWLKVRGSLDFAGGTSIHINAGIAALVAAVMLGQAKVAGPVGRVPAPLDAVGAHWHRHSVAGLVRFQCRFGRRGRWPRAGGADGHVRGLLSRRAGLGADRTRPRRGVHHAGGGLGRGGRAGGDHPRLRLRRPDGGDRHRLAGRGRVLPGGVAEAALRLRRLSRRGGRALRRRAGRLAHDRVVVQPGAQPAGRRAVGLGWPSPGCCSAAVSACWASRCLPTRSPSCSPG